jgi:hypothetical protein
VIQTGAGKVFLIDKTGGEPSAMKRRALPLNIHYNCGTDSSCTLSHDGSILAHVRLRK